MFTLSLSKGHSERSEESQSCHPEPVSGSLSFDQGRSPRGEIIFSYFFPQKVGKSSFAESREDIAPLVSRVITPPPL